MNQPNRLRCLAAVALLALAAPTIFAAPPGSPWITLDVGDTLLPGSTDVDAAHVWTIRGGGEEFWWSFADTFHFAYQRVKGNGSVTARYLGPQGAATSWSSTGLMIRQSDATGSPYVASLMAEGAGGLYASGRFVPEEGGSWLGFTSRTFQMERNTYLRLQRVNNDIAGFVSRDGQLWAQADFPPQSLPSLGEAALFGLTATGQGGNLFTARLDQVSVGPAVSVYGLQALAGDRTVTLQWRPVPNAVGYHLYRGPDNATAAQLVKLTAQPVNGTAHTESGDALVNGTVVTYALAPVFAGAPDGPLVTIRVRPVAVPVGWFGCSLNEGPMMGNVLLDPATNQITLRGSGTIGWTVTADQCYFYGRPQAGDFQVTVKALTRPTLPGTRLAGLMIRESVDGSARQAFLSLTPSEGLPFWLRGAPRGNVEAPDDSFLAPSDLKLPITLRLTRQENTITPEYALDDGLGFRPAGAPLSLRGALPATLYVGVAATANDRTQTTQARFSDLNIQPLP